MDRMVSDLLSDRLKLSWKALTPQGRAKVRHDLIKEYPDDEIWDYLEYIRFNPHNKEMEHPHFIDELMLVSNKGNVRRVDDKPFKLWLNNGTDYLMARTPGVKTAFMVHRAVCFLFNPVPLIVSEIDYRELQVNHINGIKTDVGFDNLEWLTPEGNNRHAVETGLRTYKTGITNHRSIPILVTVKIPGNYENTKFIIAGTAERKKLGLGNSWNNVLDIENKTFKGCSLTTASDDQIELYSEPPTDELIALIKSYDGTRKGVIIGTHIKSGEVIKFNGMNEMEEAGFNNGAVYNCCNGRIKQYKGWTFRRDI